MIEDTGPLTRKRMETVEDDLLQHSLDFIDRAHEAGKPFLLWHNSTRMHVWTRLSERWKDKTQSASTPMVCRSSTGSSVSCSRRSTSTGWPKTRSSSSRPTTGPRSSRGRMAGHRLSGARRVLAGKAASVCRSRCAGQDTSRRARCSTASSRSRTSCRPSWPLPVSRTSRSSCCRATRRATRTSASTLTGTTSFPTSAGRARSRRGTSFLLRGARALRDPLSKLESSFPGQERLVGGQSMNPPCQGGKTGGHRFDPGYAPPFESPANAGLSVFQGEATQLSTSADGRAT